ncbi:MAG: TonB-dependent receptor plug domain-containing protein [Rhizomicrobium sp.]
MALFLGGVAAQAQDTPADTIETVLVTARKHAEPIQQTPIAITAFTANDLAMRNVTNLSNVAAYTPNLVFDQGTGNTGSANTAQIFIRGIGQTDFLFTTEPGVGIYIDGVYLPRAIGSLMDMVDVQQVEVLKGPQGTLFGQNSVGGAINITTKEPTPDFGGEGSVTVGNYSRHDFQGTVNVPLGDDLLTSLSLISRNEDGYVKRPFDKTT